MSVLQGVCDGDWVLQVVCDGDWVACHAGRACTGKRVFYADVAVPPAYCMHGSSPRHLPHDGQPVRLKPGDYVAVEVVKGTDSALRARPLARSSIAEFVAMEGSTAPLPGGVQSK